MNWTELLTKEMEATYAPTKKMLALLTDSDLVWKPATGDNWMTVGQLLAHINGACGFCCRGFVTGEWGMPGGECEEGAAETGGEQEPKLPTAEQMPAVESIAAAQAGLAADHKLALEMVAKAGEKDLATLESAAPWEPDNQRVLGHHLLQMVQHLGTHKAQLFYYLKLMGRPVDTMTLWGM